MSSNVQHEDVWPVHVSSICMQSIVKDDDSNKPEGSKAHAGHRDANLTEHDYIGLSSGPSSVSGVESSKCSDAKDEEPACGDTELRLGIGPYNGDVNASHATQHGGYLVQSMPHQHVFSQSQMLKQAGDGANVHYRSYEGMSGAGSLEFHQSFWPWGPGVAPGRFMIPVPKVSMVPAKRPFLEVVGENSDKASFCALPTNPSTPTGIAALERSNHNGSSSAPPLQMVASPSPGGGFHAWSSSISMQPKVVRAAWQGGNCDQGVDGASITKNLCSARARALPPLLKPSSAPPVSQYDQRPLLMSNSPGASHASSSERAVLGAEVHNEDPNRNKAPVVGWPPVRSFRKNTLQSAAGLGSSKGTSSSPDTRKDEDTSRAVESVADQQIKASGKNALFVKAKLDGVRICRKVDLASYSSYDSLKLALQEMFQGFVCSENAKLDLLDSENYVLTHEDKDGDWMLVGDVPWRLFVTTVKSLRIMKAVDAVGLGAKVFAKLKAQDEN